MQVTSKKRIGILRGGSGKNYEASIKKGGEVISFITDNLGNKYQVSDILVDKDHIWHFKGIPINPSDLSNKIDVVWNVSHPSFSNILDSLNIPNVGISPFSQAMKESREILAAHVKKVGGKIGRHMVLPVYQEDFDGPRDHYATKKAKEIHEKFGAPWIVKSLGSDLPMATHVARTFPELIFAIEDGLNHGGSIVVEEFITGKESRVHSIRNFRGENIYVIPPTDFSPRQKDRILSFAKNLHHHLGAPHYLNTSFVLHPYLGIFVKDIDFHPDLKQSSHLDESLSTIGAKMHHVVENILE